MKKNHSETFSIMYCIIIVSLGDADKDNDEIRELMEEWERSFHESIVDGSEKEKKKI